MNNSGITAWFESGPFAGYKWAALFSDWTIFAEGFLYTLVISIGSLLLAVVLGIIFGFMSSAEHVVPRAIARIYVEFFQNTPLLIQVFFVYFGLPLVGITLNVSTIGIICVGIYHGAYISEVVRSGIRSVNKGQFEAAYSQGLSYIEAMRYVILPQAIRVMLPPFTNQVVNLVKNTATIALISGMDIMFVAKSWSSVNVYYGPAYVVAGLLYFILCFPLAKLARWFEEKNKSAYAA